MARWFQNLARTALNALRGKSNSSIPITPQKLSATAKSGTRVSAPRVTNAPHARTTPLSPKEALRKYRRMITPCTHAHDDTRG